MSVIAGGMTFGLVMAPSASGATLGSSAKPQKVSGYSWNAYKGDIKPGGFTIPKGSVKVGATVTVKRNGSTVAKNRSSYAARPGSYTAISAIRYRSKTPIYSYRTVSEENYAHEAKVATVTDTGGGGSYDTRYAYTGTCHGWWWDDTSDMERTSTWPCNWTDDDYVAPGKLMPYPMDYDSNSTLGEISWVERYVSSYEYGDIKTVRTKRSVHVVKVANTPVMTRPEWNAIGSYDGLSRVRSVVGSKGTRVYDDGSRYIIEWRNSAGGVARVGFEYGTGATDFRWLT